MTEMLCYIHGAYSTPVVWNYVSEKLDHVPHVFFTYSATDSIIENFQKLKTFVKNNHVTRVVGHSYGGILAALLLKRGLVKRAVTISAPLGGFAFTNIIPISPFSDVGILSPYIRELATHEFNNDNLFSIITTGCDGYAISDGVVTVTSQRAACGGVKIDFPTNHFEILLKHDLPALIDKWLHEFPIDSTG